MPIWLRKFTINRIIDFRKKEKAEYENATKENSKTMVDSDGKVNVPEFLQASKPYKGKSSYK